MSPGTRAVLLAVIMICFVGLGLVISLAWRRGHPLPPPQSAGIVWRCHFGGVWVSQLPDGMILTVTARAGQFDATVTWPTGHVLRQTFGSRGAAEHWCESKVKP